MNTIASAGARWRDRINHLDEWCGYILDDFDFTLAPGSVVIDVGCGHGTQLRRFAADGHCAFGVDLKAAISDPVALSRLVLARAEALPFRDACADAVLIKVVLPYTNDREALAEISRVLKVGGRCILIGQGLGYWVRYGVQLSNWRRTVYGYRALLNSAIFFVTGWRLPGFLGDTIAQTKGRLNRLYKRSGLVLENETPSRRFLGLPVFIYHDLRKIQSADRV